MIWTPADWLAGVSIHSYDLSATDCTTKLAILVPNNGPALELPSFNERYILGAVRHHNFCHFLPPRRGRAWLDPNTGLSLSPWFPWLLKLCAVSISWTATQFFKAKPMRLADDRVPAASKLLANCCCGMPFPPHFRQNLDVIFAPTNGLHFHSYQSLWVTLPLVSFLIRFCASGRGTRVRYRHFRTVLIEKPPDFAKADAVMWFRERYLSRRIQKNTPIRVLDANGELTRSTQNGL